MEPQRRSPLDQSKRRKVVRRAFLKPLNLLNLVAGVGLFAITGIWWILPLTLAVYAAVVFLAARDPLFIERVTGEGDGLSGGGSAALPSRDVSPERRARWLSRGETRDRVDDALVTYRKVLVAIDESDDVTMRVLEGAVPKLHEAANRLVDVASNRDRAAKTLDDFATKDTKPPKTPHNKQRESSLQGLRDHIEQADREIENISDQFMTLRAQVVRASMDTTGAKQQAEDINGSLDGLNYRLEALNETFEENQPRPTLN